MVSSPPPGSSMEAAFTSRAICSRVSPYASSLARLTSMLISSGGTPNSSTWVRSGLNRSSERALSPSACSVRRSWSPEITSEMLLCHLLLVGAWVDAQQDFSLLDAAPGHQVLRNEDHLTRDLGDHRDLLLGLDHAAAHDARAQGLGLERCGIDDAGGLLAGGSGFGGLGLLQKLDAAHAGREHRERQDPLSQLAPQASFGLSHASPPGRERTGRSPRARTACGSGPLGAFRARRRTGPLSAGCR